MLRSQAGHAAAMQRGAEYAIVVQLPCAVACLLLLLVLVRRCKACKLACSKMNGASCL
jgi:hypothetical protein